MKPRSPSPRSSRRGVAVKAPLNTEVILRRILLGVVLISGIVVSVWFFIELFELIM